MRVRSQAIELSEELCKLGGKPPQLVADEPDASALGPKALAARWRELLRRGSAPEMRESKTAHLLASLERTGQTSHAPPGANLQRWRPSGASSAGGAVIWLTQVEMEDGKPRVHPLERLLFARPQRRRRRRDDGLVSKRNATRSARQPQDATRARACASS
jgi:hypothetical protein